MDRFREKVEGARAKRLLNDDLRIVNEAVVADSKSANPVFEHAEFIKNGAFGVVYKAVWRSMEREVAVKFLRPQFCDDFHHRLEFEHSAKSMGRVHHQNFAQVYIPGSLGNIPYIIMDLIPNAVKLDRLREVYYSRMTEAHKGTETHGIQQEPSARLRKSWIDSFYRFASERFSHISDLLTLIHEGAKDEHRDIFPRNFLVQTYDIEKEKLLEPDNRHSDTRSASTEEGAIATIFLVDAMGISPSKSNNGQQDIYRLCASMCTALFADDYQPQIQANGIPREVPESVISDRSFCKKSRVPPQLIRILKRGMSSNPSTRYNSARELATDLREFSQLRPVKYAKSSFLVNQCETLHLWWRRSPWQVMSVLLILVLSVAAESLRRTATFNLHLSQESEDATLAILRNSTDDVIQEFVGKSAYLGSQEREFLERTLSRWQSFSQRSGDDDRAKSIRAEGQLRVGQLWQNLGDSQKAQSSANAAISLLEELRLRLPNDPHFRIRLAECRLLNTQAALFQDQLDFARTECQSAIDVVTPLLRGPSNESNRFQLLTALNSLGTVCRETKEFEKGKQVFNDALQLHPSPSQLPTLIETSPEFASLCAWTHNNFGNLLAEGIPSKEAEQHFRIAEDIWMKLLKAYPSNNHFRDSLVRCRINRGSWYSKQVDNAQMVRDSLDAFESAEPDAVFLSRSFPAIPEYTNHLAGIHFNTGNLYIRVSPIDYEKALTNFGKAQAAYEALLSAHPDVPEFQNGLATSIANVARSLVSRPQCTDDEKQQALLNYDRAIEVQQKVVDRAESVPDHLQELAGMFNNRGTLLRRLTRLEDADRNFQEADRIWQGLTNKYPHVQKYQQGALNSQLNLGVLRFTQERYADAKDYLRSARDSLLSHPDETLTYRQRLAECRYYLGETLVALDNSERSEVLKELVAARDEFRRLINEKAANANHPILLASAHALIANELQTQSPEEAIMEYNFAIDLLSDHFTKRHLQDDGHDLVECLHAKVTLLIRLQRSEGVLDSIRQACQTSDQLIAQDETSVRHLSSGAKVHETCGDILSGSDTASAQSAFESAAVCCKKLIDLNERRPLFTINLVEINLKQSATVVATDKAKALEYIDLAKDLMLSLEHNGESNNASQLMLAKCLSQRMVILKGLDRQDEVRQESAAIIEILSKLSSKEAMTTHQRLEVAAALGLHGLVAKGLGLTDDAEKAIIYSIDTIDDIPSTDPEYPIVKQFLSNGYRNHVNMLRGRGDHVKALTEIGKLLAVSDDQVRVVIAVERASLCVLMEKYAEAVNDVRTCGLSSKATFIPWTSYYDAACALAIASPHLSESEPKLADEAMELLKESTLRCDVPARIASLLLQDHDLDPLRERDDFKSIVLEYGKTETGQQ